MRTRYLEKPLAQVRVQPATGVTTRIYIVRRESKKTSRRYAAADSR
jgi:hypothetical protein